MQENKFDVDKELEFWHKNKDKFISIGEVGLDYKNGKETVLKFLIGQTMTHLRGRGNPALLEKLLREQEMILREYLLQI